LTAFFHVQGVEGLGFLVVVAVPGQVRGGLCTRCPEQAGETDGVAQAVAGESLEGAVVAGRDGSEVVHDEAGMMPGREQARAVLSNVFAPELSLSPAPPGTLA